MADDAEAIHAAELKKKRQFRKYAYRGVDLEDLLDKSSEEVITTSLFKRLSLTV
jgi:small subunit ribosomal protein S15e